MQNFPSRNDLPERIHDLIIPSVERTPDAIALEDAAGRLSYAELGKAIEDTAERLRQAGLRGGDRLLVVCENCNAVAVLVLAASRLDAEGGSITCRPLQAARYSSIS